MMMPQADQNKQDVIDARRWRAIRERHASALCRIVTGSRDYNSAKAPALLDAWADAAAAEVEAFDPEHYWGVEVPARIAELERDALLHGAD